MTLFHHKNYRALSAAIAFSFAALTFSGCSADIGDNSASSGSASSGAPTSGIMAVSQGTADTEGISDARNTPAVRAAKAIGPAVVGITNKAVARDWFNNPVETEGVGSGVIFRADGYIVTNNHSMARRKSSSASPMAARSKASSSVPTALPTSPS